MPSPRKRWPIAVVAVLAVAAGLTAWALSGESPAVAPGRPTILRDDGILLDQAPERVDLAMARLHGLGVDWVSLTADWSTISPRADRPARWGALDTAVRLARRHRLEAMVEVGSTPPSWALGGAPRGIDPAAFATFSGDVARRYSGHVLGLPAAVAFALGDEPNRPRTLGLASPAAAPERYRAMLLGAVPAVRRAAPRSLVLIGNTAPSGTPGAIPPLSFLRRLACLSPGDRSCAGQRLPGDAWAQHGLGDTGALAAALARLHAERRTASAMPIYLTEHGLPSRPPDPAAPAGLYEQARRLGETEWLAYRTPGVRSFAQTPFVDASSAASGLELPGGIPKPSREAFAYTLVVHRAGPHSVVLWGHIRPGPGKLRFRVAVRGLDGTWRALPVFNRARRTDRDGYFRFDARTAPGGTLVDPRSAFRLELRAKHGWRPAGLPIFGAAATAPSRRRSSAR